MENVRPPAVAGAFYPAEPAELAAQVEQLLARGNAEVLAELAERIAEFGAGSLDSPSK